jgi:hypothetical protein
MPISKMLFSRIGPVSCAQRSSRTNQSLRGQPTRFSTACVACSRLAIASRSRW